MQYLFDNVVSYVGCKTGYGGIYLTGTKTTSSKESLAQHGVGSKHTPSTVTIIESSTSKSGTGLNIQQCTLYNIIIIFDTVVTQKRSLKHEK